MDGLCSKCAPHIFVFFFVFVCYSTHNIRFMGELPDAVVIVVFVSCVILISIIFVFLVCVVCYLLLRNGEGRVTVGETMITEAQAVVDVDGDEFDQTDTVIC